jgi:hypothetical protein
MVKVNHLAVGIRNEKLPIVRRTVGQSLVMGRRIESFDRVNFCLHPGDERSVEQLEIEAPAIVLVEAKRDSLNSGIGQCMAEMIAAQRFNQQNDVDIPTIYGATTSGTAWRFLKLEGQTVTIDLTDYALSPIERLLGMLTWMVEKG